MRIHSLQSPYSPSSEDCLSNKWGAARVHIYLRFLSPICHRRKIAEDSFPLTSNNGQSAQAVICNGATDHFTPTSLVKNVSDIGMVGINELI